MSNIAYRHSRIDNMGPFQLFLKRVFDITISTLSLIILLPVFTLLYVILLTTSGRPVIFKQERIGFHGKPFLLYKYRTLNNGVEDKEPLLHPTIDETQATGIQRFLRRYHLDELPQLWNILKGEMSFVGPRPERKFFIDKIMQYNHDYELIYEMRPGLTSEATLYNGYTDTMDKMLKRLKMDIIYLRNRTIAMDIRTMYDTVTSIMHGKKI